MSEAPPSNRRATPRFLAALPATVRIGGQDHACSAEDLSRSGVLLVGDLPQPDDPRVTVRIRSNAGDLELELTGEVAHVRAADEPGRCRVGLRFEALPDELAERLERLVSRVVEGVAPAALEGLTDKSTPSEVKAALGKIPQAHRINLASRARAQERGWLRFDSAPPVLEALARNPHINLPEIKSILRIPSLLPSTLEILADDSRWARDEETQLMIATHPRVTFQTADKVAGRLAPLALQRLIRKPGLQPGVKQKLMTRFAKKHRGTT